MGVALRRPAAADSTDTTIALLLAELVTEIRGLRADMRERERPAVSLSRVDRDRLAAILPVLAGVRGSDLFSSAELCESDAAAMRLVCAGLTAKQLARLLRRAVDLPQRPGRRRRWRVESRRETSALGWATSGGRTKPRNRPT